MIKYRISRPFNEMAEGPYPKEKAWQEIGLGHLLPMKLTGDQWPVQILTETCFQTGPGGFFTPKKWHKITDAVEIGFDELPAPLALQREDMIPGAELVDASGQKWIVPNANPQSPICSIPREISWTIEGATTRRAAKYGPLSDLCVETFEAVIASDHLDYVWSADRCLKILQANYRIGTPELVAFEAAGHRVIDRDFSSKVVLWFIDFQLLDDVVKKNERDALTSSAPG